MLLFPVTVQVVFKVGGRMMRYYANIPVVLAADGTFNPVINFVVMVRQPIRPIRVVIRQHLKVSGDLRDLVAVLNNISTPQVQQ